MSYIDLRLDTSGLFEWEEVSGISHFSYLIFLVSECLQYPDFSCVAVYRKIVIGFAFLVPDATHIEAYVSFIFTHPEWRRKGVARFMLYHLIQVDFE